MPRKTASRLLTAALAILGTAALAGDPPSVLNPGEIVVRTPEDVEQGKKNVQSVADQLRTLFEPSKIIKRQAASPTQPDIKIIPAPDDRSFLVYRCRYATATKLGESLDALLSDKCYLEPTEEQNQLLISGPTPDIEAIAQALPAVDVPSAQVLIEAKVVEVMITDGMQRNLSLMFNDVKKVTGVDGDGNKVNSFVNNSAGMATSSLAPTNSPDGGKLDWIFTSGDKSLQATFQWLLNAQDAKVLSSPTIVVGYKDKATISNGQDIPIQSQTITNGSINTSTTFKRVGVTLKVTPMMVNSDSVTLKVEPEVSNIQSYQTISQGASSYQVPVISVRNISTYAKLESGQTVIMGGLYNSRESVSQERIPFLSDMPYFGEMFTSKYRTKELIQLVFFLRVHILTPGDMADGILFDPDQVAADSNELGEIIRKSPALPHTQNTFEQVKQEFIERTTAATADGTAAKE